MEIALTYRMVKRLPFDSGTSSSLKGYKRRCSQTGVRGQPLAGLSVPIYSAR